MVKEIERRGEVVGTEAKSAVLAGLALAGRLEEARALYGALRREGAFPEAYSVGILLVGCLRDYALTATCALIEVL
jgi:pentatricopeptide repeat protein